jgi:metallo-beta-lactamase family protein
MCEAGRIKHHLKHNLWRPECTILFVGYQAEGTLGRRLLEGEKVVKIFSEEIGVNAKIVHFNAFSGHADQAKLVDWVGDIAKKPKKIFLVHGELDAKTSFKELLETECGENVEIPYTDELYTFGEDITIDKNELKNNISLKLRLFEEVVFLKQDVDTYVSNIKHDIRSDISKEELDSIMEDITKLKEYLGNLRAKL